jgi:hypothetical protein
MLRLNIEFLNIMEIFCFALIKMSRLKTKTNNSREFMFYLLTCYKQDES